MRGIGGILGALALLGADASATAATTPPPCVTREQVSDFTLFALPAVIDAVADKCRASLRADAYLLNGGHDLSRRLGEASGARWQGALAVFRSLGGKKMPEGLSAETVRGLIRDMMATEALKKVTPAQCAKVNEGAELLAPLPPDNLGRLMALMFELVGEEKGFKVCS
jgi:hypothetical protein